MRERCDFSRGRKCGPDEQRNRNSPGPPGNRSVPLHGPTGADFQRGLTVNLVRHLALQNARKKPGEGQNKPGAQPGKQGEPSGKPEGPGGKPGGPPGKPGDAAKPEEAKPTLRHTTPPNPPNADELKVRPDADGKVRFSFQGQPWEPVLKWLADISGMSLDWQKLPGDFLNLSTKQRYTVRETRDLINQHLLARGYTLLCSGEVLTRGEYQGVGSEPGAPSHAR